MPHASLLRRKLQRDDLDLPVTNETIPLPAVLSIAAAAARLQRGGLLAYPTEGVWGVGCDPFASASVQRLLALKQRAASKGLILIAAALEQLDRLIDWTLLPVGRRAEVVASWPGPHTWLLPRTPEVPALVCGDHTTLAVRITAHPIAAGLCRAFGGPLISTSANLAGEPPPRKRQALDPRLLAGIDGLVEGETSGLDRPTSIRDALSGQPVRA